MNLSSSGNLTGLSFFTILVETMPLVTLLDFDSLFLVFLMMFLLLIYKIILCSDKAYFVDLFVRASNMPAIKMYEKVGILSHPSYLWQNHFCYMPFWCCALKDNQIHVILLDRLVMFCSICTSHGSDFWILTWNDGFLARGALCISFTQYCCDGHYHYAHLQW